MLKGGQRAADPGPGDQPSCSRAPRDGRCPFCRESRGCLMLSGAFSPPWRAPPFLPKPCWDRCSQAERGQNEGVGSFRGCTAES